MSIFQDEVLPQTCVTTGPYGTIIALHKRNQSNPVCAQCHCNHNTIFANSGTEVLSNAGVHNASKGFVEQIAKESKGMPIL
jgi:hypothetical protein